LRRTGRRDKSQVKVKGKIKAKVKVEENFEFFGLITFIGFIVLIASFELWLDRLTRSLVSSIMVIAFLGSIVFIVLRVLLSKSLSVLELIRKGILNGHPEVVIEEELVCRP